MKKVRNIDELLDGLVTLPSLPQSIDRISQLLNDPKRALSEVGHVISADPALALKTLRLINSAFYGLRNKVLSVEHAVTLLGARVIKNLALSAAVFNTFGTGADRLLRHSVACGVAMRILVRSSNAPVPIQAEDAFAYGLLHDIGKIILQEYLPDEFAAAVQLGDERRIPAYQAELEVFGTDHAKLGGRLAQQWKLPDELTHAIVGHHELSQCRLPQARELAAFLSVADYICIAAGMAGVLPTVAHVEPDAWDAAHFTATTIPPILDQFFTSTSEIAELIEAAR